MYHRASLYLNPALLIQIILCARMRGLIFIQNISISLKKKYQSELGIYKSMKVNICVFNTDKGPGGSMSQIVGLPNNAYVSPIRRGLAPGFVNYKNGALDSQPQVIKVTSCLSVVGGSVRLLPLLKLVAMIQLKYC